MALDAPARHGPGESPPGPATALLGTLPRGAGQTDAAGSGECRDELRGELARVSCDREAILLARAVAVHPDEPTPARGARAVLDAVADLLERRQDILLVRIEVCSAQRVRTAAQQRAQMRAAQRRADAILRYLWLGRGVWAERLEALGRCCESAQSEGAQGWPVSLRIVQWALQSDGGH
jgi:hypothetical protein